MYTISLKYIHVCSDVIKVLNQYTYCNRQGVTPQAHSVYLALTAHTQDWEDIFKTIGPNHGPVAPLGG